MSRGKYSPRLTRALIARASEDTFLYNADRVIPEVYVVGQEYSERLHFADYDSEGFDRYGYSGFLADGTFVGLGQGVDRAGQTESDYVTMSDRDFEEFQ